VYVLDTSAILSGKSFGIDAAIPPAVLREIKKGGVSWRNLQYMKAAGLEIIKPPANAIKIVKKFAEKTGDIASLSDVDIEVLALALHLRAMLLTDDYAMQNVAAEMGIKYRGIEQEGIKEKLYWKYRCKACGRYYDEYMETCPVCGGKLKRVRK